MTDEVFAFLGRYAACDGSESFPEGLNTAQSHLPKQSLQLGKYLFDGVEVRTICRQEQQGCAGGLYGLAHRGLLVGGQIVHHDDVAGLQCRHQDLFNIAQEQVCIDRTVEHGWCDKAVFSQRGDEGRGLPVTVGCGVDQPRAALTTAPEPNHIGFGPGLIDEDQPGGGQTGLALTPLGAGLGNVGSVLLCRVQGLFLVSNATGRGFPTLA
jgi:hypothetical protein